MDGGAGPAIRGTGNGHPAGARRGRGGRRSSDHPGRFGVVGHNGAYSRRRRHRTGPRSNAASPLPEPCTTQHGSASVWRSSAECWRTAGSSTKAGSCSRRPRTSNTIPVDAIVPEAAVRLSWLAGEYSLVARESPRVAALCAPMQKCWLLSYAAMAAAETGDFAAAHATSRRSGRLVGSRSGSSATTLTGRPAGLPLLRATSTRRWRAWRPQRRRSATPARYRTPATCSPTSLRPRRSRCNRRSPHAPSRQPTKRPANSIVTSSAHCQRSRHRLPI